MVWGVCAWLKGGFFYFGLDGLVGLRGLFCLVLGLDYGCFGSVWVGVGGGFRVGLGFRVGFGLVLGWFRVGLGLVWGWFGVAQGLA